MAEQSKMINVSILAAKEGGKQLVIDLTPEACRFLEAMASACGESSAELWECVRRETAERLEEMWLDPIQFQDRWVWSAERTMRCGRAFSLAAGQRIQFPLGRDSGRHDIVFYDGAVVEEIVDGESVPPPPGWVDPDRITEKDGA